MITKGTEDWILLDVDKIVMMAESVGEVLEEFGMCRSKADWIGMEMQDVGCVQEREGRR